MSYIAQNRTVLSKSHYIRKAGARNYWLDFSHERLERYRTRLGDNFSLVLFGSEARDDAYVIPYPNVKEMFAPQLLDPRGRWIGYIKNNLLRLNHGRKSMSVSAFYNAFELLDGNQDDPEESDIFEQVEDIDLGSLRNKIRLFNERYRNAAPHKKRIVSEQVARPGAITDYLKEHRNFTCQLCGERGFLQPNKIPYIEAHHIVELHELVAGSYCSDNIVVVCPTCHKKLHYATTSYEVTGPKTVIIEINGTELRFERNTLTVESGAI